MKSDFFLSHKGLELIGLKEGPKTDIATLTNHSYQKPIAIPHTPYPPPPHNTQTNKQKKLLLPPLPPRQSLQNLHVLLHEASPNVFQTWALEATLVVAVYDGEVGEDGVGREGAEGTDFAVLFWGEGKGVGWLVWLVGWLWGGGGCNGQGNV